MGGLHVDCVVRIFREDRLQTDASDAAKLRESLRVCQLELAQLRASQEEWLERNTRLRRNKAKFQGQANNLAAALAAKLSSDYWREQRVSLAGLRRVVGRADYPPTEREHVRLLESTPLFRGPWYLKKYPDAIESGLSPAVHYLRHGADQGYDPSPEFSTSLYLEENAGLGEAGVNPLVHYLTKNTRRKDEH
jgi:hypothetical protein